MGGINQKGSALHCCNNIFADEFVCRMWAVKRHVGKVKSDDIRTIKQHIFANIVKLEIVRKLIVWFGAPGQHPHAESLSDTNDLCAHMSRPDNAQGLPEKIKSPQTIAYVPACHTAIGCIANFTRERKDQPERKFSD